MKTTKKPQNSGQPLASSFRDPAGFVYRDDKQRLLRHIAPAGMSDYIAVRDAGLYKRLADEGLMITHSEVSVSDDAIIIAPKEVKTISYPFEWSFSMLRDAALSTLNIQKTALAADMVLKDASAYNIQFLDGKPILIDTLSFEPYKPGEPWVAYGQFCRHFLAPLALMSYTDIRLSQMSRDYIDGIPLDLASKLLPRRARLRPAFFMHLTMHSRAQQSKAQDHKKPTAQVSKTQLLAIIDSLERVIKSLRPRAYRSEWMDYYDNTNYSDESAKSKQKLIADFTKDLKLDTVIDIGGNDGHYSQPFADKGIDAICPDIDPHAVEYNYRNARKNKQSHMLPLLVDLMNPGGAIGWANEEREAIHERLHADLAMSLALVHHVCISNNVPLPMAAEYFSRFAPYLIIEFVPKSDSQVQKLLATRKDVFPDYVQDKFEEAFQTRFSLVKKANVSGSKRTLYLFKRK